MSNQEGPDWFRKKLANIISYILSSMLLVEASRYVHNSFPHIKWSIWIIKLHHNQTTTLGGIVWMFSPPPSDSRHPSPSAFLSRWHCLWSRDSKGETGGLTKLFCLGNVRNTYNNLNTIYISNMSLQLYEIWNWLWVVPMKCITSNCKSSKFNEIRNALRLSLACQLPSQLFPCAGNDRCSSKWTWWWWPQNLKMPRNIEKLQASATHKNGLCRRKDTELDRKKEKQDKCTHHHLIIH